MPDIVIPERVPRHFLLPSLLFFGCFLLSLAGIWLAEYTLLNHDMAGIIAIAQEIIRGKHLYSDVLTSQCPLIVYMMMVPIGVHAVSGIPVPEAFFLCLFLLLQLCVLLSWRMARRNPLCGATGSAYALLCAFYYGLFLFPFEGEKFLSNFGQREHIFCALILPYVIRIMNRLQGIDTPRGEQAITGILAGIGFCIKPHFALLFVLSEFFLMISMRRFFVWNRLDAWLIILFSICYYAWFLFSGMMPAYWELVPHFVINSQGYKHFWSFICFFALWSLVIPVWFAFALRRSSYAPTLLFLLTLICGGEMIYTIQRLHYFYHLFPVYFFSLLLFVFGALALRKTAVAFLLIPGFFFYVSLESCTPPDVSHFIARREEILKEAALLAPYKKVVFLNTDMGAFPVINYAGVEWDLSLPFLDYLPITYRAWQGTYKEPPYHTPENMGDNERFFHEKIIQDLQRLPDAIVVDESPAKFGFWHMQFDYLHYFMSDPRFRELWKQYEFVARFPKRYDNFLNDPDSVDVIYRRKAP